MELRQQVKLEGGENKKKKQKNRQKLALFASRIIIRSIHMTLQDQSTLQRYKSIETPRGAHGWPPANEPVAKNEWFFPKEP